MELAGGFVASGVVLVSGGLLLVSGGLVVSGVVLTGGCDVLGDVLVSGGFVLLLGLFTSLCGMLLPALLQSDEIIFTLLTLRVFELEDEGFAAPAAVPVALPLPDVVPVTEIM